MPDSAAKVRLKAMTAWDKEPTLSDEEIDSLLTIYSVADADGYEPGDEDWVETYNLRAAAAEGWRWKAARSSELQSTDLDGDRMSSNQIFEHCQRMIKTYSRATASPSVGPAAEEDE